MENQYTEAAERLIVELNKAGIYGVEAIEIKNYTFLIQHKGFNLPVKFMKSYLVLAKSESSKLPLLVIRYEELEGYGAKNAAKINLAIQEMEKEPVFRIMDKSTNLFVKSIFRVKEGHTRAKFNPEHSKYFIKKSSAEKAIESLEDNENLIVV